MTTYARIIDGHAVDVVTTPPELADRFHPEWLARQVFIVVPDGTIHGATDNGDGTFKNPPPVVESPVEASPLPAPDPIAVLTKHVAELTAALAAAKIIEPTTPASG